MVVQVEWQGVFRNDGSLADSHCHFMWQTAILLSVCG